MSISSNATHDVDCAGGVCAATAKSANLNTGDLTQMLASGDITVKTGSAATDIVVHDGFSWASTSRLTLDAMRTIEFRKLVTVAGTGAVTLAYNDGGKNGDLLFSGKGKLDFSDVKSALTVNGTDYTLVRGITNLANAIAANPSGAYALAADYNAKNDGVYAHAPIRTHFDGIFEGLGHTIRNLAISSSDDSVGFFWATQATIRDFRLKAASITAQNSSGVGVLAAGGIDVVRNVSVDGAIKVSGVTMPFVGGLIGGEGENPLFTNCSTKVSINSTSSVPAAGGLIGISAGGLIVRSRASGDIVSSSGDKAVTGGLLGQGLQTAQGLPQIQESYATSNVTVFASSKPKTYAGGLVGIGAGTISNSYATGSITGGNKDNLGGLVGGSENTAISHAYAVGAVSDSSYAGGVGGRIKSPQFDRVYWDTDTSGRTSACGRDRTCNGAAGLTDAQLKSGLPDGFDPKIWAQDPNINNGYPYLRNNPPQ